MLKLPGDEEKFAELVQLEPALASLRERASLIDDQSKHSYCANAAWYGRRGSPGLKRDLKALVGWSRGRRSEPIKAGGVSLGDILERWRREGPLPVREGPLFTSAAYDCAYRVIYDSLPECRNCGCTEFG